MTLSLSLVSKNIRMNFKQDFLGAISVPFFAKKSTKFKNTESLKPRKYGTLWYFYVLKVSSSIRSHSSKTT